MMIKLDPWKRIDKEKPFDEPESIFYYNGSVKLPVEGDELFEPKLFSADKIKNVLILRNEVDGFKQVSLSVQFAHCIATTSLNTGTFEIHIKTPSMVKKHQVRGDEDEVFYARNLGDRDQIVKLFLHDNIQDKVVNT